MLKDCSDTFLRKRFPRRTSAVLALSAVLLTGCTESLNQTAETPNKHSTASSELPVNSKTFSSENNATAVRGEMDMYSNGSVSINAVITEGTLFGTLQATGLTCDSSNMLVGHGHYQENSSVTERDFTIAFAGCEDGSFTNTTPVEIAAAALSGTLDSDSSQFLGA